MSGSENEHDRCTHVRAACFPAGRFVLHTRYGPAEYDLGLLTVNQPAAYRADERQAYYLRSGLFAHVGLTTSGQPQLELIAIGRDPDVASSLEFLTPCFPHGQQLVDEAAMSNNCLSQRHCTQYDVSEAYDWARALAAVRAPLLGLKTVPLGIDLFLLDIETFDLHLN